MRGVEVMKRLRPMRSIIESTNGPGKLTTALQIDKRVNGIPATSSKSDIFLKNNLASIEYDIGRSYRIGVSKDLDKRLRFFIKGNKFVSQ
jgi:DNA-3-methyladenine glycosylase